MAFAPTLPIFNALTGLLPCEGPRALPFDADFSATTEWDFDFTQQWNNKDFTTIQCAYIDNSANAVSATLIVNGTGQTIVAPPNSCGYYTLLATQPPKFALQSTSGGLVHIDFMNFYVPPTVWKTT